MKIIAYYRVSTAKQGKSGLGLEGQRAALETFASQQGATVVADYQEIESGKRSDRPQLARAVAHAKRSKATLVVAKLDRLSRNVAFLSTLLESGIDFVACDNPHANKFTIHILAAVAEHEAEAISLRTKAALEAAKRRGKKLGSARPGHWQGREAARQRGAIKGAAAARRRTAKSVFANSGWGRLVERAIQGGFLIRGAQHGGSSGAVVGRGIRSRSRSAEAAGCALPDSSAGNAGVSRHVGPPSGNGRRCPLGRGSLG
jgi:DNA invertase Pin-like site-specific DNA recombinase